jgi:nucleotide-binding universal stress UspA family protein
MDLPAERPASALSSIFHATDFSPESEIAFVHALKLAIVTNSALRIMHVEPEASDPPWQNFPKVRATLARWGMSTDRSGEQGTEALLHVNKLVTHRENPVASILQELKGNPADLMVLAIHQHDGLDRLKRKTVAEPVVRQSRLRTLLIPAGVKGFVGVEDGMVRLRQILIPVDHVPSPQPALDAAAAITFALRQPQVSFILLHIGNESDMPQVNVPTHAGWVWETSVRSGDVVEQIQRVESECSADLIVMSSVGKTGFLDALRGSTTERVVRGARCPVFVIPDEPRNGT